jgi:hypothetical protein
MNEPDDDGPGEPPSSLPPDPFARNQESAVGLHEYCMWLRSGGFSMTDVMFYLAARDVLTVMIAVQEAAIAARHEQPETPEQD